MKKVFKIGLFSLLAVVTCGASITFGVKGQNIEIASAKYTPGTTYTTGDAATYYNSISDSLEGDSLLSALRTLNLERRKKTIGYSAMGTSSGSSAYVYTDYDPKTVQYDKNGQPFGTKILSFYSGISTASWNREHVWPNSRGGGSKGKAGAPFVDADIFMPRPTITEENSNRGNSVYVEGMTSSSSGWDPVAAFEKSMGVYTNIRGECARIIFYCMTVNANLKLNENTSNDGTNMGKLTDLLRWNLKYSVNQREVNRNEGGEYLQGNRNAFVDHPEYACKIWGNTSNATREICSGNYDSVSLSMTSASIKVGSSFNLIATASNGTKDFTWSSSNPNVATVNEGKVIGVSAGNATITVSATIEGNVCSATCAFTVTNGDTPTPPTPTPAGNGTLENPFSPSQARTSAMTGMAYVKGQADNIKVNGDKVTLTLFDVGNVSSSTGINVYDIDASGLTIGKGDIVIVKATKSTTNISLVAPGFVYSVEKNPGGCSGSIITSSIILFSTALVGLSAVIIRKKKEEK